MMKRPLVPPPAKPKPKVRPREYPDTRDGLMQMLHDAIVNTAMIKPRKKNKESK
jgi:hypothetical protein